VKKFIFVADMFEEQYAGGAEITTESIIEERVKDIIKVNSHMVSEEFINNNVDKYWFFCNFANLDNGLKLKICKKLNYSIIEYDYKFCKYRSIEKHKMIENKDCNCTEDMVGKINLAFYGYAKKTWFMSEKQRNIFLNKIRTIKKENTVILSSIFRIGDLRFIGSIRDNEKNDKYLILNSSSWIKDTKGCVEYAKLNNLNYELVKDLPYHELLIKMSCSKGLIFRPLGGDTCPRIVIEAKLLGCDLMLNDNVQHRDEEWFDTDYDINLNYLKNRVNMFWRSHE
jgi:hypothetical protein|tara:strand:- start:1090 stop:1938 length:849 start_codon:yes stop_codon:yes gene_type:complete